jgi:transcriptional regulator with XRE-family HTH domain
MKDINDVFGKNVRLHRKKREISPEKLAELADLHRTYIGAIERGDRNVSLRNVQKIAFALDVPVIVLFDGMI